ncbi:MAG: PilC/PilY family type IV pilus protein [Lautropia sp.]|nr:PilC/PilY family type IV pilus protein [Lautropia sp.]
MKESFPARKKNTIGNAVRAALLLMSCALAGNAAQAQTPAPTPAPASNLAQEPLITKDPGIVEPNILFTLDDSGSMAFNYLPDSDLMSQIWSNSNGRYYPAQHLFAYHPKEPDRREYVSFVEGLLSTSEKNILGARRRASAVNTLYYNPEVRYRPWIKPDGKRIDESNPDASRMLPANPKAAYFHLGYQGDAQIAALTIDLTVNAKKGGMPICSARRTKFPTTDRRGVTTYPRCPDSAGETEITPAVYFDFNWPGKSMNPKVPPTEDEKNNISNYSRVVITDPKNTTFTRGKERTDCTPVDVTKAKHICTQAQELQNFANWYQYHRTRMHVAIAAVGEAFMALPNHVRVGYGRINKDTVTDIDGVGHEVIEQGVRHLDSDARKAFINWLNGTVPEGGTPLVNAMERVGLYFKRKDDGGPWADEPGKQSVSSAGSSVRSDRRGSYYQPTQPRPAANSSHLSCRRSFHVLMTDGMYNFGQAQGKRRQDFNDSADTEYGSEIRGISKGAAAVYQYRPERPYASAARGSLADYAMRYWKDDLRDDLQNNVPLSSGNPAFWQHLVTHTLSFGVSGRLNHEDDLPAITAGTKQWPDSIDLSNGDTIDDLWHAAVNSRGTYVNVQEGKGFHSQLETILGSITGTIGNTTGVAMSNQALQTGNTKFVPSFVTREWTGEVTAYGVDQAGNQQAEIWKATDKLPEPNKRRLYVGKGATTDTVKASEFVWKLLPADMKTEMASKAGVAENLGDHLVNWMRGDQLNEGGLFRRRVSIPNTKRAMMGHFVNSTPAYVGATIDRGYSFLPAQLPHGTDSGRDSYKKYVENKKARDTARPGTLFIGGNDGILHAFDEKTGAEVFGFIPRAVVGEMAAASKVGYKHRFLVDGPLVERDAFWDGKWKNVLVGSTGAGSTSVFALNVTDTRAAELQGRNLLWEITQATHPALGHVLSQAEVGVTRDGKWVAVFGNGYESVGRQAQLFIVELETGKVKVLNTGAGSATNPNGLGGVTLVRDGTQVITAAYAGDLHGNVWKFDLASENSANWGVALSGQPLFVTEKGRPITAAPATVTHPAGGVMVLVGTGKLFENGDELDASKEFIYGLWDNQRLEPKEISPASGTMPARIDFRWEGGSKINASAIQPQLAERSRDGVYAKIHATAPDWNRQRGWSLPLTMLKEGGQRLITQPLLVTGMALFETMTPAYENNGAQNACQERLRNPAFSLLLDPLSGQMSEKSVIDTDGNRKINSNDQVVGGWYVNDWTGRSVILTQPPPEPCKTRGCTVAVRNPIVCDKGYLMSSAQGTAAHGTSMCVEVPGAGRWWWRELAVPDVSNGTQRAPDPDPAASGTATGSN